MHEHATTSQFLSKAINKMLFTYDEAGNHTYLEVNGDSLYEKRNYDENAEENKIPIKYLKFCVKYASHININLNWNEEHNKIAQFILLNCDNKIKEK